MVGRGPSWTPSDLRIRHDVAAIFFRAMFVGYYKRIRSGSLVEVNIGSGYLRYIMMYV